MSPTTHSRSTQLPHRRRAWLFGVAVPIFITVAALLLVLAWVPRLPDPVAVHWGSSGVDSTGSVAGLVVPLLVMSLVSLLVLALFALFTGRTVMTRRLVLGLATGLAILNAGMMVAFVHAQLDVPAAELAADPGGGIFLAAVLAIAAGAVAAFCAGADRLVPAQHPVPPDAARADLRPEETVVWSRTVTTSPRARRWSWIGVAVILGLGVLLGWASGSWWIGALIALCAPPLVVLFTWHVQVGDDGLTARAGLGWPRQHIPAVEVERADAIQVDPFVQFGGTGLKIAPDVHSTVGVVVRKGEGIAVRRSNGRRVVVTVDDAATGAALLNTYAERARSRSPRPQDAAPAGDEHLEP